MSDRLVELARKREGLVARSASQRQQLCGLVQRLERPLTFADKGVAVVRFLRAHPLVVVGGGTIAAYLIGSRVGGLRKLAGLTWGGWKVFRHARSWWSRDPG